MDSIHISLQAETLGYLFGLPITNSLVLSLVTALLLVGGGFLIAKRLKWVPGKAQGTVELIIGGLLDFMTQVVGDRKQAFKFFPLVATILFCLTTGSACCRALVPLALRRRSMAVRYLCRFFARQTPTSTLRSLWL